MRSVLRPFVPANTTRTLGNQSLGARPCLPDRDRQIRAVVQHATTVYAEQNIAGEAKQEVEDHRQDAIVALKLA